MTRWGMLAVVGLATAMGAGCGSSSGGGTNDGSGGGPVGGGGESRDGEVYSPEPLVSNVDGEAIAITVLEPTTVTEGATYPLILHSHGYGGARQATAPAEGSLMDRLRDAGYGIVSIDERGHNESGGTIRILDPALEGQDLLQILDWAETTLGWLAYDNNGPDTGLGKGNPIIGAIGSSYGGGYQHLIWAIDSKHRLDAIAPDITWNDLRYSLFSGGVFKTFWATLLSAGGNLPPNTQDPQVNQGLVEGLTLNMLSDTNLELLYHHSLASHCAGENAFTAAGGLTPIDAFVTQSAQDTLFNFNDAYANFQCLSAQGGDVRLFTKAQGHGIDNGDGGDHCGEIERADATFAWFEEKLYGRSGVADFIPGICLMLGGSGSDAVIVDEVAVGGTEVTIESQSVTTGELGGLSPVAIPVYTAPTGGDVLAGIPVLNITVTDPLLGDAGVGDPIFLAAMGRAGGEVFQNQYRPIRGYGEFSIEMNGVFERLAEGEELMLLFSGGSLDQYAGSTGLGGQVNVEGTISLPLIGTDQPAP
ncbi:CocE/NonD family hydrolase [Abyssibacter sp.]|uniref:CocE/NonD family hydrolase n=1 Tax=Abyssibacter sp. TaxID=2320200 RepID=UPI000C3C9BF8|nr:hypothetical protein [Xanthomonadales bacterium]